jgi:hypothetical protein
MELENDQNTRTQPRFAPFCERHMGERHRRLTLAKQRRMGVAHRAMKVLQSIDEMECRLVERLILAASGHEGAHSFVTNIKPRHCSFQT